MSRETTVSVEHMTARYGERVVLDEISMTVQTGEVHVILGGSGCGKSTLLKHMVGLILPAAGRVELLGIDLAQAEENVVESTLGRIGMLFQGGALINSLTLADNVALPINERHPELPTDVVAEMVAMKLALVGLAEAAQRTPPELSGGMKKRAALARAMALDPAVLFCDEPSAGLDPVTAADLDRLILALRDQFGMSVVVVTHELASIEVIADRVTMLDGGHIVAAGPYAEVRASDDASVRAFFDRRETSSDGVGSNLLTTLQQGAL